jgi:hypothetical protein
MIETDEIIVMISSTSELQPPDFSGVRHRSLAAFLLGEDLPG